MKLTSLHNQFSEAWKITFRNPLFWLFGFFASLTVTTGFFESGFRNIFLLFNLDTFFGSVTNAYQAGGAEELVSFSTWQGFQNSPNFILNLILIIVVLAAIVAVAVWCQISLIIGINRQSGPFASTKVQLSIHGQRSGRFWNVLATHIFFKIAAILIFIILALPLLVAMMMQNYNAVVLSTIFFFLFFIPLALGLTVVRSYAAIDAALYQQSVFTAISQAWKTFKRSLLISYESVLFLMLVRYIIILITILILAVAFIPAAIVVTILVSANYLIIASVFATLLVLVAVGFVLAVRGMYATYDQSVWTLVFKRLEEETVYAKLVSLVETSVGGIFSVIGGISKMIKNGLTGRYGNKAAPVIEERVDEASMLIDRLTKTLEIEYGLNKTKIESMKKDLKAIAKTEKERFMPSLKKALAEIEHDYKVMKPKAIKMAKEVKKQYEIAKPKVQAFAKKTEKNIEKNIPVVKKYVKAAKVGLKAAKKEMAEKKGGKKK